MKNKLKLRDRLALEAMKIIYQRESHINNFRSLAEMSYNMADYMLEVRSNK
jgi:hypothetical protein